MSYQKLLLDVEWFSNRADAESDGSQGQIRFSTASILFSFISIESFINNMMSDFASLPPDMFTPHERGFLTEKVVELSESGENIGKFEITNCWQPAKVGHFC